MRERSCLEGHLAEGNQNGSCLLTLEARCPSFCARYINWLQEAMPSDSQEATLVLERYGRGQRG
jgi:hypothetical protein